MKRFSLKEIFFLEVKHQMNALITLAEVCYITRRFCTIFYYFMQAVIFGLVPIGRGGVGFSTNMVHAVWKIHFIRLLIKGDFYVFTVT